MGHSHDGSTSGPGEARPLVVGQKLAFAAAALVLGVASFVNMLGMEKALLAIAFGALALKSPGTVGRRGWAIAGIVLGVVSIVLVTTIVVVYWDEAAQIVEYLEKFG